MVSDFVPVYRYSHKEAEKHDELADWQQSFRENVACSLALEKAMQSGRNEALWDVLDTYGFKRVRFILSDSLSLLGHDMASVSQESRKWLSGEHIPKETEYNRCYAVPTDPAALDKLIRQVHQEYEGLHLYDQRQCDEAALEQSLEGKVLVMSPKTLKEECWSLENQLWLAEGGFGCDPKASGRAVYATCLADGERVRWNREDFVGVLDEQYLPEWAQEKLTALRAPKQEQAAAPTMGGMEMR